MVIKKIRIRGINDKIDTPFIKKYITKWKYMNQKIYDCTFVPINYSTNIIGKTNKIVVLDTNKFDLSSIKYHLISSKIFVLLLSNSDHKNNNTTLNIHFYNDIIIIGFILSLIKENRTIPLLVFDKEPTCEVINETVKNYSILLKNLNNIKKNIKKILKSYYNDIFYNSVKLINYKQNTNTLLQKIINPQIENCQLHCVVHSELEYNKTNDIISIDMLIKKCLRVIKIILLVTIYLILVK